MSKGQKIALGLGSVAIVAGIIAALYVPRLATQVVRRTISGSVLVDDKDSAKQVPIANAEITVTIGKNVVNARSDQTGLFRLTLPRKLPNQIGQLVVRHPDYLPFEDNAVRADKLYLARLMPTTVEKPADSGRKLSIRNVRIRYTVKAENTFNVGSIVRPFTVPNQGNQPCGQATTCSPDRKWKASLTKVSFDAGESNQFVDIRASCVAGPCAFTRIQYSNIAAPVRVMELSVLNWSDTATYLVEAEVRRTMVSDLVRQSFPAILGNSMDFSLPAQAEGPSIQAELNGTDIVFPLGPNLLLSWATCSTETAREQTRLYRCELKRDFVFR